MKLLRKLLRKLHRYINRNIINACKLNRAIYNKLNKDVYGITLNPRDVVAPLDYYFKNILSDELVKRKIKLFLSSGMLRGYVLISYKQYNKHSDFINMNGETVTDINISNKVTGIGKY